MVLFKNTADIKVSIFKQKIAMQEIGFTANMTQ